VCSNSHFWKKHITGAKSNLAEVTRAKYFNPHHPRCILPARIQNRYYNIAKTVALIAVARAVPAFQIQKGAIIKLCMVQMDCEALSQVWLCSLQPCQYMKLSAQRKGWGWCAHYSHFSFRTRIKIWGVQEPALSNIWIETLFVSTNKRSRQLSYHTNSRQPRTSRLSSP